jgi:hypothetical protein
LIYNIQKHDLFTILTCVSSFAIAVGKLNASLKIQTEFKKNVFLLLLRSSKKKIKLRELQKMSEERETPTASFHARMIEGFYRKSAECPSFQLAAASFPRRKTARIRHERAYARR